MRDQYEHLNLTTQQITVYINHVHESPLPAVTETDKYKLNPHIQGNPQCQHSLLVIQPTTRKRGSVFMVKHDPGRDAERDNHRK